MYRHAISQLSLVFLIVGCSPDVDTTLNQGQRMVEPVVGALEAHRAKFETYPKSLRELIEKGLLAEVPELPTFRNTYVYQPRYRVAPDGSFYLLSFAYNFPDGGSGLDRARYYLSDQGQWQTSRSAPGFDMLVIERWGHVFREKHTCDALKIVAELLVERADRRYWSPGKVTKYLGQGEEVMIPPDVHRHGYVKAIGYACGGENKPSYVFVYGPSGYSGTSPDHFMPGSMLDVYATEENADGSLEWKRLVKEPR